MARKPTESKNLVLFCVVMIREERSQQLRGSFSLQIWFNNTPHNKIAELKSDQGWMIQEGEYFVFPGGGTMFPEGGEGYVEKLANHIPLGTSAIRTALDIGCGVCLLIST